MNIDWIDFLNSNGTTLTANSELQLQEKQAVSTNSITALTDLSIIKITGKDASQFLQGQLTCNIKELIESNSYFTAFCNAKGRTISTLLILKIEDGFLCLLPDELVEKVITKLRMYILRSDVQLRDETDELCLLGLTTNNSDLLPDLPKTDFAVSNHSEIIIKLPSTFSRYLIISPFLKAKSIWSSLTRYNLSICHPNTWKYLDISAGLPWLTKNTSEEFIPQMLNIDKLGGLSFNKGCYTGQEIIARTHYLGKAKRELFLAECHITAMLESDIQIISSNTDKSIGKVLSIQCDGQKNRMLIVIPTTDAELSNLRLDNANKNIISIIDYQ
jgi:folate-binding protein YgfZ